MAKVKSENDLVNKIVKLKVEKCENFVLECEKVWKCYKNVKK